MIFDKQKNTCHGIFDNVNTYNGTRTCDDILPQTTHIHTYMYKNIHRINAYVHTHSHTPGLVPSQKVDSKTIPLLMDNCFSIQPRSGTQIESARQ